MLEGTRAERRPGRRAGVTLAQQGTCSGLGAAGRGHQAGSWKHVGSRAGLCDGGDLGLEKREPEASKDSRGLWAQHQETEGAMDDRNHKGVRAANLGKESRFSSDQSRTAEV